MQGKQINYRNSVEGQDSNTMESDHNEDQQVDQGGQNVTAPKATTLRNVNLNTLSNVATTTQAIAKKLSRALNGTRAFADTMAPYWKTVSKINAATSRIQSPQLAYPNELVE